MGNPLTATDEEAEAGSSKIRSASAAAGESTFPIVVDGLSVWQERFKTSGENAECGSNLAALSASHSGLAGLQGPKYRKHCGSSCSPALSAILQASLKQG